MRRDALGLFWRDEPPVKKEAKVKPKCTPPDPVWLDAGYLPNLDEARAFNFNQFTDHELAAHAHVKDKFTYDTEIYPNYFLAGFKSKKTGKIVYFEMIEGENKLDTAKLKWVLENFTIVGFNSNGFDIPITMMALAGATCAELKWAVTQIIEWGLNYREVLAQWSKETKIKIEQLKIDHYDLMEVAPLRASLKVYAGRMHCPRMQDLPFHPDIRLSPEQICITRWYWANDLQNTEILDDGLEQQIKLRESLGRQYNMDLRSKSDAQIAEYVISQEVQLLTRKRTARPTIAPGTCYRYKVPAYMQFRSPLLQHVLKTVAEAPFIVAEHGSIEMPKSVGELKIPISQSTYTMGIGGLHSTEKKTSHIADQEYGLFDIDVTGFYPQIIINQSLYPYHLGREFLQVYKRIVDMRIGAKRRGDKVAANSLKIVVNGSYGKLGSKWSNLYAPDLLIQVTMTGQLALLLIIERLELAGIRVVSANTDGIVIKCLRSMEQRMRSIVTEWEKDTRFDMEWTEYSALYSRDVNNYIAIKCPTEKLPQMAIKTKGAYANPWSDHSDRSMWLHKNPTNTICTHAIEELFTKGIPIVNTIMRSTDVSQFVSVRTVKGGAVKGGDYLGKSVRWYYAEGEKGDMVYATSGKKVPRSDGAMPLLAMPHELPKDVDHAWYIRETEKMLKAIGYG